MAGGAEKGNKCEGMRRGGSAERRENEHVMCSTWPIDTPSKDATHLID